MSKLILGILFAALSLGCAHAQQPMSICVQNVSHTGCANEITPSGVSTTTENGHVAKATPGVLIGFQANNWATGNGLTVMAIDGTAVPSNGTLATCTGTSAQTNPCIMKWYGIPAAGGTGQPATLSVFWSPGPPLHFLNGLVLACSSTGPTTLTLAANCTFSADAQ